MGEIAVLQPQDILKNQPNRRHRNNLIKPPLRSKKPIKNLAGSVPAKVSRRKRHSAKDLVVPTSAGLLGPLSKKLSKQKETHNFYAGSSYSTSPSPSSLPLPSFCKKKSLDINSNDVTCDSSRILKLDLDGVRFGFGFVAFQSMKLCRNVLLVYRLDLIFHAPIRLKNCPLFFQGEREGEGSGRRQVKVVRLMTAKVELD
ncbi:Uncharacterized protein Adt_39999 [Abeliophyllum distichum]|uniref:Uncharacterized protein n=1 Tax=Abeliophyllum distichum TaxID=126358 RepID=A0ABD1Q8D0_9LAMI